MCPPGLRQFGRLGALFSQERTYATSAAISSSVSWPPNSSHQADISVPGTPDCTNVVHLAVRDALQELFGVQRRRVHTLAVVTVTGRAVGAPQPVTGGHEGRLPGREGISPASGFDRLVQGERGDEQEEDDEPGPLPVSQAPPEPRVLVERSGSGPAHPDISS